MKSLDLFSGIGGITYALRGLGIQPVMYVEIEPNARAVLEARMTDGCLPVAPIHSDVCTLEARHVQPSIDIIVAGFPCVGFSTSGLRAGLRNDQSKLFYEVMRLARELKPPYLFLENVGSIRSYGLKELSEELEKLNYHCWWIVLPAYVVGAPQFRKRWYCLCVHKHTAAHAPTTLTAEKLWQSYDWSKEPETRMIHQDDNSRQQQSRQKSKAYTRCGLLGNSVVPDSVRLAFLLLWTGLKKTTPSDILHQTAWTLAFPQPSTRKSQNPLKSAAGMKLMEQNISHVPTPFVISGNPPSSAKITLDPNVFVREARYPGQQTSPPVKTLVTLRAWGTPRHGMVRASNILTERSKKDLQTQLRFERRTQDAVREGYPNPSWIDWLMGFPVGWTDSKDDSNDS